MDNIVSPRGLSSPQMARDGGSESQVVPLCSGVGQERTGKSCFDGSHSDAMAVAVLPENMAPEAESESFGNSGGSSTAVKKLAWNKSMNGAVEVSPVMGAESWPALSETTRAYPKSSSSDSLKGLSDGSPSPLLGTGISSSSSSPKQVVANSVNPNTTSNHPPPTRQRSMKRGGGVLSSNVSANGAVPQPPSPPQVAETKPGIMVGESSLQDHRHKGSGQRGGFGSQPHSGNDHPQQRNSFRRGNGGPYPRGDGSYHHGYGGRRDQDRGNPHRSFSGREANMQPPRVYPRGYMRPTPPTSTPFIHPTPMPMQPFGNPNPIFYPEMGANPPPVFYYPGLPPETIRAMHVVPPMPHLFVPVADPQLLAKILEQVNYYFSDENLIKDQFLRKKMDDHGWVPISLIADFRKISELTKNIQVILYALRTSTVVEVQGYKIRKRENWMSWILRDDSIHHIPSRSNTDILAARLQNVTIGQNLSRTSSTASSSQSYQSGNDASK